MPHSVVEHWENVKLKCSEISTFQNCEIKMQWKYTLLQFLMTEADICVERPTCPNH